MRQSWCVGILSLLAACGWVTEVPCGGENLLTISQPSAVETFEVRDAGGAVLWKIHATTPREVRSIRLGEVPEGFVQTVPEAGGPRDFGEDESLTTFTVAKTYSLRHEGIATGARAFCGGFYESTPRRSESRG